MITKDTLFFGREARGGLISGIKKCREAVGCTMGTGGSNSIIETIETPNHRLTNDGATILEAIRLADHIEEMGRKILLESVSRSNKSSGDGSSTATVLTAAILEDGLKHLESSLPMDIKRSLEDCIPLIEDSLTKQKKDITVEEVGSVASISAEDEQIGARIQEIYGHIGKTGIIHWDISKTTEDTYTIGQGITVEGATMLSPYMADLDEKTGQLTAMARWKNPTILITKEKITTAQVFESLFTKLNGMGKKEVVVFCDEVEPTVIPQLIQTRVVRGFKTLLVKVPTIFRDDWYEDLAKATGATVIDPIAGITFKHLNETHVGTAGNIVVDKENTYIDGILDLSEHIEKLKLENTELSNHRAARLNTKTARYFVGGISDSAISHRRFKVEDAIAASYHALNHGVLPGGGVALLNASRELPNTIGGDILREALTAPIRQIIKNTGSVYNDEQYGGTKGMDTRTKQVVDMVESRIYDPFQVVLNAVKNAISVSAAILTINTLILLPRDEQQYYAQPNVVI